MNLSGVWLSDSRFSLILETQGLKWLGSGGLHLRVKVAGFGTSVLANL